LEKEVELDLEGVASSFTDLGKAIASLANSAENYSEILAQKKQKKTPEKENDTLDPLLQLQKDRQVALREFSSQLQLAGLPQAEIRELVTIQENILALGDAEKTGLITRTEEAAAIKSMRKELVKASARAEGIDENQLNSAMNSVGVSKGSRLLGKVSNLGEQLGEMSGGFGKIFGSFTGLSSLATGGFASAGVMGGGLALFGAMLFGATETSRLGAQYGQIYNLAVADGDSSYKAGVESLAAFQEKAQHYYGVAKTETLANIKIFVDAGSTFKSIFSAEAKSWGEVGENAVTMSIGLDKFFESGDGFAAKTATSITRNYNLDLEKAIKVVAGMEFQAKNLGFSVSSFVSWTLQATGNVRELGGNLEETASALIQLKKKYIELGFTGESANRMANEALQSLVGGLAHMSTGQQISMATELGLGSGLAGRQELLNGIARGEDSILEKATKVLRERAMKAGGGREFEARFVLQETMGFSGEGARAVLLLGEKFDKGLKLTELKATDKALLRKAFIDEGTKTSAIEKNNREMMDGIAELGKGLLTIIGSFLGVAIVGFKATPDLIYGSAAEKSAAVAMLDKELRYMDAGLNLAEAGSKKALSGVWHQIEPLLRPVKEALSFNAIGVKSPEPVEKPSPISSAKPTKSLPSSWDVAKSPSPSSFYQTDNQSKAPTTKQLKNGYKPTTQAIKDLGKTKVEQTEDAIKNAEWQWLPGSSDPDKQVKVQMTIQ